jgi:hypothetical protein
VGSWLLLISKLVKGLHSKVKEAVHDDIMDGSR